MPNKYDYKRKIDHTLTSDDKRVVELADRLLNEIEYHRGEPFRNRKQYIVNLTNIILNLFNAIGWDRDLYVAYSRNANRYKTRSRYNKLGIGFTPYTTLVDALEELDYIEAKTGFKFKDVSRAPVMKATDKLIRQFALSEFDKAEVYRERELIVFKGKKQRSGYKPLEEFADTPKTYRMRDNIKKINAQIATSDIWLELTPSDKSGLVMRYKHGTTDKLPFDDTATSLYRVFNEKDWKQGGRFVGHFIQSVPKEFRRKLTIDDEAVCEMDFSGMHLNALYLREGLPRPTDDVYTLPGQPPEVRGKMKTLVNVILNSSSEEQAINAIRSDINAIEELPKADKKARLDEAKDLMVQFKSKHAPISHHFYSGVGRHLMYDESVIAEGIMLRLADKGITCLPIHDSFIVQARHATLLKAIMEEESMKMYGSVLTVKRSW